MTDQYNGLLIEQKKYLGNSFSSGSFFRGNDVVKSQYVDNIVLITESDYNALAVPDPRVMYLLIEDS